MRNAFTITSDLDKIGRGLVPLAHIRFVHTFDLRNEIYAWFSAVCVSAMILLTAVRYLAQIRAVAGSRRSPQI